MYLMARSFMREMIVTALKHSVRTFWNLITKFSIIKKYFDKGTSYH